MNEQSDPTVLLQKELQAARAEIAHLSSQVHAVEALCNVVEKTVRDTLRPWIIAECGGVEVVNSINTQRIRRALNLGKMIESVISTEEPTC